MHKAIDFLHAAQASGSKRQCGGGQRITRCGTIRLLAGSSYAGEICCHALRLFTLRSPSPRHRHAYDTLLRHCLAAHASAAYCHLAKGQSRRIFTSAVIGARIWRHEYQYCCRVDWHTPPPSNNAVAAFTADVTDTMRRHFPCAFVA